MRPQGRFRLGDGGKELFEGLCESFGPAPAPDDSHVDFVAPSDPEGGAQALPIPPMKKRGEAGAARVGRREREEGVHPDAELGGRNAYVAADGERPTWELHEETRIGMLEAVAVPSKTDLKAVCQSAEVCDESTPRAVAACPPARTAA